MGAAAPVVMIAATAISTGVAAYSAHQQGQASKAQAEYRAKVAENNSIMQKRAAEDALERGRLAESQRRQEIRQNIARHRAGAAARGVEVDSGSALEISKDIQEVGELDALTIRRNATREALGFENRARQFESEAGLETAKGRQAKKAGQIGAFSSIVSGAGSVSSKWYDAYGS